MAKTSGTRRFHRPASRAATVRLSVFACFRCGAAWPRWNARARSGPSTTPVCGPAAAARPVRQGQLAALVDFAAHFGTRQLPLGELLILSDCMHLNTPYITAIDCRDCVAE